MKPFNVTGKVALVTGGRRGWGKAMGVRPGSGGGGHTYQQPA